ncbi:MAG: DEAD/DEAH box helicase family protein [Paludibacteraceae bacterium]|nr:DEAD/DEAH box helicase family protein [Paludibacteraceae bacterium]
MESGIFDNKNDLLIDDLKEKICDGSKISVVAASFSIYAYEALKDELNKIDEMKFIFNSPTFDKGKVSKEKREFYIPKLNRERNLFGTDFELKLRNNLTQKAIAYECAEWIRKKVKFKTNITNQFIAGLINIENGGYKLTYQPFNEFTTTELGCERGDEMMPMKIRQSSPISDMFLKNFIQLWNNEENFKDVTEQVIENISNVYKENAPDFIYFLSIYNIFKEFLNDISEDVLPNEATGFKKSVVWNKLYNFQKDACLGIINKLEKYNGCILADSVGLGKTFTALSVIKYYENRNKSVLVLCPKKLKENWNTYKNNYVNNPLQKDRLRYDVLFHTDLSRNGGESNGISLDNINWGNYDLLVIDESHNFRNGGKIDAEDDDDSQRANRYTKLMMKVIKEGVKTKVLMLSATPVNNRFNDLKNQLQLAYEGDSSKINDELNITGTVEEVFRKAQYAYNQWAKLPAEQRTTENLLQSLSFDFFELLDSVTIARSRKHIEKYYDTTDIGTFPERLHPVSRQPALTNLPDAPSFNDIFAYLEELKLAIYIPSMYILPSAKGKYGMDMPEEGYDEDNGDHSALSLVEREKGIHRLMSIQMLKRLESSVNSFRLTVNRIVEKINTTLAQIAAQEDVDVDDYSIEQNEADEDYELFIGNKKNKISLRDLDTISWKRDLENDLAIFNVMLDKIKGITPEYDSKLQSLLSDIADKIEHPLNGDNKKVIIFTAFSDTAEYIYDYISEEILNRYHLNTALVSGDIEAKSTLKLKEKLDFNKVLTLFSPVSKEKNVVYPKINGEIDILIATDCISEGQNLQDCDYLINYDIHWNPVRIIQRFGRVDRIGSRNKVIQLVNYWPDMTLDEYIKLKSRVEARMKAVIMSSTGDENPIDPNESGDLEYRKEQLKRLKEEVIDLEDMNTGISIVDLGLNDFRMDLLSYIKENPDIEHSPHGLHAVVKSTPTCSKGIIYILKNIANSVNINSTNRLHPFYMVYIGTDGQIMVNHLHPKKLLDKMRLLCKGKSEPDRVLCQQFNKETKDGRDMSEYSKLLGSAIASIINVKEESDIDSFLTGSQLDLFDDGIKGLDDFELISFLVIK